MIFPESVSIINQKPIALQLLPLAYEFKEERHYISYIFEPTKEQILGEALIRLFGNAGFSIAFGSQCRRTRGQDGGDEKRD